MADYDRDGSWVGPFVLGMIVGILLTLGVGGVFVMKQYSRATMEAERARHAEMEAREEVLRALEAAEAHRKAEQALREEEKKARTKGP